MKPLKPLQGESPTGYYRYDGTPITAHDVKYYEKRGVVFKVHPEGDLLPDGVRLKPRRIRGDKVVDRRGRTTRQGMMSPEEFDRHINEWEGDYEAIEGPKPDYFAWIADRHAKELGRELLRNALCSNRVQMSSKAISTLLEYGKSKPKAQVEVSTPEQPAQSMTVDELLVFALESKGLDAKSALRALQIQNRLNNTAN